MELNRKGSGGVLTALQYANLALSFLLELSLLVALAYWGFHAGTGTIGQIALGIGIPLLVAVLWGIFLAPRATVRLPAVPRFVVELVLFGLAVAGLAAAGQPSLAWVFGLILVVNRILIIVWRQ